MTGSNSTFMKAKRIPTTTVTRAVIQPHVVYVMEDSEMVLTSSTFS